MWIVTEVGKLLSVIPKSEIACKNMLDLILSSYCARLWWQILSNEKKIKKIHHHEVDTSAIFQKVADKYPELNAIKDSIVDIFNNEHWINITDDILTRGLLAATSPDRISKILSYTPLDPTKENPHIHLITIEYFKPGEKV